MSMQMDYDVFSDIFSRPSIKQLPLLNIGDQVKMVAIGAHANMDFNNSRIVIRAKCSNMGSWQRNRN